jgi:hypothetical protein
MGTGGKADRSPPFSAEAKKDGAIPPFPNMSSWHSASLIKDKDFTYL